MSEPEEEPKQIYALDYLHDWADVDDLVPEKPVTPDDLKPDLVSEETVGDVDELFINKPYGDDESPEFYEESRSVDASPEELAGWLQAGQQYAVAQQRYRARIEEAATAYEAAVKVAQAELRLAMQAYAPTDEQIRARSKELAATLHSHREAADQWRDAQEEKKQAALDAEHGPRQILIYPPKHVDSANRQDRIAKVHLSSCNRRPKGHPLKGAQRAHDAWKMMKDPNSFSMYGWKVERTEFKFCSSCKPWKVFQEHIKDFPKPTYRRSADTPKLGPVLLTELPDNWHD